MSVSIHAPDAANGRRCRTFCKAVEGATPGTVASDVNGMRIKIFTATALATLGVTGSALAQTPQPVPQEALDRPVAVDVSILDAGGATVGTLSCEWSVGGPGDDDRPCLKFQSDPQVAFGAIEAAGGVRAQQRTVVGGDAVGDMAISLLQARGRHLADPQQGHRPRRGDALRPRLHRRRAEVRALGRRRRDATPARTCAPPPSKLKRR